MQVKSAACNLASVNRVLIKISNLESESVTLGAMVTTPGLAFKRLSALTRQWEVGSLMFVSFQTASYTETKLAFLCLGSAQAELTILTAQ